MLSVQFSITPGFIFILMTHQGECQQHLSENIEHTLTLCTWITIFCCVKVKTCPLKKKKHNSYTQKAFWGHCKVEKVILTHFTDSSEAASAKGDRYHLFRVRSAQKCFSTKDGGTESFMLRPVSFWFRYVAIGGFSDPNGFPEAFLVWGRKPQQVKKIGNWSYFNKAVTLP